MQTGTVGQLSALDTSQVKNLGIGSILIVALVGLVLAYLVTRVVAKIIVIAVVIVVCFVGYHERSKVIDAIDKQAKNCDVTFFGIHVKPSNPTVKQACAAAAKHGS